jgi:RHS repeat-associated protein
MGVRGHYENRAGTVICSPIWKTDGGVSSPPSRENDGTGLYYYRARYYYPTLQRFISEDPMRFESGDVNLYSYVFNSPFFYIDPLGLVTMPAPGPPIPGQGFGAARPGGRRHMGIDLRSPIGTCVVASDAGTILSTTPEALDRLQQGVTPQGTVSYAYDNANRRASMTVLGQPAVTYGYDAADRLTSLTQGAASVTLGYDDANRRSSLTLPNGVVATYGYSTRDELTSVTFTQGATTLGTLTYTYDAAGRRAIVGGTWARTGLPGAVASATYDDANRQLTWGGQTLTYDDNGNLTGDGTNTYTRDARDRLTGISGGVAAAFAYDPFGRRTRKTISGQTTDVLYDWDNPVQELSGGVVLANLLTGLGIDEYFTRTDGSGRRTLLGDALGSILALTDDTGVVQTSYTYEPFGQTTVSGQGNANPFQYTGRENDGTGLYYYRARYYHPQLQRFIGEDPIRFEGGDVNLYAYVANNPVRWTDPLGLRTGSVCVKLSIGGFGFGGGGGTCVNFGHDKKQGFSVSLSGTAGAGGFAGLGGAVGISVGGSNAPTVFDLTGGSVSLGAGGGVGIVGGGIVWTSTNPQIQGAEGFLGYGLKLNPALAVPVAVEGYLNTTSTILGYGSRRGLVGPSQ